MYFLINSKHEHNAHLGFTLVEMLLTVAISALAISIGGVKYNEFNQTQKLKSASLEFKNILRDVQVRSLAGVKPDIESCDPPAIFNGYTISYLTNTTYQVEAVCDDEGSGFISTYSLPTNMVFEKEFDSFTFNNLGEGTSNERTISLKNIKSNTCYHVKVTQGGSVEDLGEIACEIPASPTPTPLATPSSTPHASSKSPTPTATPKSSSSPSATPKTSPTASPQPSSSIACLQWGGTCSATNSDPDHCVAMSYSGFECGSGKYCIICGSDCEALTNGTVYGYCNATQPAGCAGFKQVNAMGCLPDKCIICP